MRSYPKIWLAFLALILLSCRPTEHSWRDLEFKNLSDIAVQFRTRGIQLYPPGRGPQISVEYRHPQQAGGYSTFDVLRLTYPVRVSWRAGDMQGQTKEYDKIPGIPEGQEIVETGGFLIVGLSPDFELRVFFITGDQRPYELADQIIRGEEPLPE